MKKIFMRYLYSVCFVSFFIRCSPDDWKSNVFFTTDPAPVSKYSAAFPPKFFADNYQPGAPCPTLFNFNRRNWWESATGFWETNDPRRPGTTQYALDLMGDFNCYTSDDSAFKALVAQQDEALYRFDLYKNSHFIEQIKQLPKYQETIKRLYRLHKHTKLPRLQAFLGDYDLALRALIFKLHDEIVAEEKQAGRYIQEEKYDKKQEKLKQRAAYALMQAAYLKQKKQAQTLLHKYEQHTARNKRAPVDQLVAQRIETLHAAYDGDCKIYAKTYTLDLQAQWLLERHGGIVAQFTSCTGNDYQHQLNAEHLQIITQTESLFADREASVDFCDNRLIDAVVGCVTVACEYNHSARLLEATSMTDTAWAFLEYIEQYCQKARRTGTNLSTRAYSCAHQGKYLHAAGYGLASLFCHAVASFDYVLAAGTGMAQGSGNVAHSVIWVGKTLTSLDKQKVHDATQKIATTVGNAVYYVCLLEDIVADLEAGNEQAAAEKLRHIADICSALKTGIEEKLKELKNRSSHEWVRSSFKHLTESVLTGHMLSAAGSVVCAAHEEAVQILSIVGKTQRAAECIKKTHSLRAVSDMLKICKEVAPPPAIVMPFEATIAANTVTTTLTSATCAVAIANTEPMVHGVTAALTTAVESAPQIIAQVTQSVQDVAAVAACVKHVASDAAVGAVVHEILYLQNSADQSHLPKHLRRSILSQPLLDPNDPEKNNNDHDKGSARREQVLPQVETYEQARNKALEIIGDVDQSTATPHIGRLGVGKGKITGLDWHDGKVTLRLDWDLTKGPHINITDYRMGSGTSGKSIAIPFQGDLDLVKSLLRHLNTTDSIDAAIEILKKLNEAKSLQLLLEHSKRK